MVPDDAAAHDPRGEAVSEVLLTKDEVLTKLRRKSPTTLDKCGIHNSRICSILREPFLPWQQPGSTIPASAPVSLTAMPMTEGL